MTSANVYQIKRDETSAAEWQARIDLAATHRLSVHYGWGNLIYNHIALRVPDQPEYFLIKPHDLMFEEVTASNLLKLRMDGQPVGWESNVNAAGFTIHTSMLNARPDLACTLHVHTKVGMAMSAHGGGLLPMTQGSMRFYNRISYHDYEGISTDIDEAKRLAVDLGPKNKAMILRNHGLVTAGTSCSEALSLMRYLIASCETQLMLEATGCKIIIPSPEICEHAARQWELQGGEDWDAYIRTADRIDQSYRD
ncbi:MAG: class II aldolase/adducin family protein [Polaromonas sp.]|nr:class II aldolase/adducin family protein [Polaromonas sp.]